jgi:hypothetical protein
MATVFILQDKTWIERGSGLVRFVFDLRTFALRLVIRPGTPDEFECKLRPRIRSKGPRAYVVRAQAENGTDEHILAVRFEREEDSRSFRRFVEKRDVDHNQKNNPQNSQNSPSNYASHLRNQTFDPNNPAQQQAYHRHQNRSSSNIAQGGGYGSYQSSTHMGRNNPYSNNTALGMYGVSNASSPSNPNKHGVQANYFWTCSRCLQMVDPSLSSCHVCGTLRQSDNAHSSQVLQQISNNHSASGPAHNHNTHNNNLYHGTHHNQNTPHQQPNASRATYNSSAHHHIGPNQMTPSNHNHTGQYGNYGPPNQMNQMAYNMNVYGSKASPKLSQAKQPKPTVHVLKLTTVNLEKHNKLFPPKRRNVKEIIHTQLEWLRNHQ